MTDDEVAEAWASVSWTDLPPDLTDPSEWLLAEARWWAEVAAGGWDAAGLQPKLPPFPWEQP